MTETIAGSLEKIDAYLVPSHRRKRMQRLIWLTWRQHRALLMISSVLVAVVGAILLAINAMLGNCGTDGRCGGSITQNTLEELGVVGLIAVALFPLFVAAFWAAPLLTREYEQRTHVLAWGHDLSRRHWLLIKASLLAIYASALALALSLASLGLVHTLTAPDSDMSIGRFDLLPFTVHPLPLVAHTLCALAFGIAVSAMFRRTVAAIGGAIALFCAMQIAVAQGLRPHYWPAERVISPVNSSGPSTDSESLVLTHVLYSDSAGNTMNVPQSCGASGYFDQCLMDHGITHYVTIYQPGSRLGIFYVIESALLIGLAAAFVYIAIRSIHRREAM